ncbi:cell envelope biogenesis protein OmpA [Aquaticitalea lipolytica]|jgi:outer membrane protein OmpA-like peptidoglycan-associated protein/tetratricopeptide (TPR) repeat protein|uniref:Cell envelope biogenesis protein OmpA n=1 Tax=Aquaticitalea lipolytica TaxID=1247562 RepID=A0A8J2TPE4_9FLAO|nr:OmpA family protein [Aquaticitalea lipolytica]GFZ78610.1 cell envelope biogenesis protein OmpA [Aquaticitalea lipolytica]
MKTIKFIFIIVLSLTFSFGYSQKGKVRQATKEYDNYAYLRTSEILLDVANNGYRSVDLLQKLGNSFYFNNKMEDAAKWYGELMAMNEPVDAEYYFRYAQALKSVENYTESDKWMKKFHEANKSDLRGRAFASRVDYLSKIEAASRDFEVKNLDINSDKSDFGTIQYKNQIIFASTRGGGKKYQWNEQPFLDLFSAVKQEDGSYNNVKEFGGDINTKYHESTVSFTPDDKAMYFTRNNYFEGKYKKGEDGVNRLKIYKATKGDYDKWENIESIPFNSDNYSVAHPSVNIKGTKLYFASDMPGTLGSSDIFVVDINDDGTLGEPVNLGASVNTEGHETFPFINEVGDLYFSSNGFAGLGGLDVFVIRDFENRLEKGQPLTLENVGKPINSSKDDFAYYENLTTEEGFFTSNRDGGKGDDDIYTFKFPECVQVVEGIVKDKDTQEIIPGATVTLFDGEGKQIDKVVVGDDAAFSFDVECDKEYLIRVEKETYSSDEKRFTTPNKKQELKLEINLEQDEQEIKPGDDLAKTLDIPIIYFDFDKSNIRPDAEVELQKVIAVLNKYPTMKIDVRSHTDSRATTQYNDALSKRRNKSTIDYIVKKGNISKDRLTGQGYGESQLVNKCSDGVDCTETEHQLNRRSEFIIISM